MRRHPNPTMFEKPVNARIETQPNLRLVVDNTDSLDGYKSGRNRCLETPEIDSTVSTRFGGTPLRRHFSTAWRDMPNDLANAGSPPSVPAIARSTGLGTVSGSEAADFPRSMRHSMQPIVAVGQQPISARTRAKMQLMVARTKEEAREIFSRELNAELDRQEIPRRGRADWLRRKLRQPDGTDLVSRQSCAKWLNAADMPDQTNMSVLVGALGLDEHKLRTGHRTPRIRATDERLEEINTRWDTLPERTQDAIMAVLATAPEQLQQRRKRE